MAGAPFSPSLISRVVSVDVKLSTMFPSEAARLSQDLETSMDVIRASGFQIQTARPKRFERLRRRRRSVCELVWPSGKAVGW